MKNLVRISLVIFFLICFIKVCQIESTVSGVQKLVESQNKTIKAIVSAYNPTKDQCDDDPHINAMNKKVQDGDIANNCLAFGTEVELNNKIYTVRDRMNKRYGCNHFDILVWDYKEAIEFGRQELLLTLK